MSCRAGRRQAHAQFRPADQWTWRTPRRHAIDAGIDRGRYRLRCVVVTFTLNGTPTVRTFARIVALWSISSRGRQVQTAAVPERRKSSPCGDRGAGIRSGQECSRAGTAVETRHAAAAKAAENPAPLPPPPKVAENPAPAPSAAVPSAPKEPEIRRRRGRAAGAQSERAVVVAVHRSATICASNSRSRRDAGGGVPPRRHAVAGVRQRGQIDLAALTADTRD